MNDRIISLSFHVSQPSHSSNKAISNFDLETASWRLWVWSNCKTTESAHYLIDLFSFCFTSIRWQLLRYSYFEIWPWKIKGQGHEWGQRSGTYNSPSIRLMHFLFFHINQTKHSRDMSKRVFDLEKTHLKLEGKFAKIKSTRLPKNSDYAISMTRAI